MFKHYVLNIFLIQINTIDYIEIETIYTIIISISYYKGMFIK